MRLKTPSFITCLLITAMISAVIAPACQAAWGNSSQFIEICTAQGIEKIALPEEGDEDTPADENNSSLPSCDFCFQQTHIHFADVVIDTIPIPVGQSREKIRGGKQPYIINSLALPYQAQGPPLIS